MLRVPEASGDGSLAYGALDGVQRHRALGGRKVDKQIETVLIDIGVIAFYGEKRKKPEKEATDPNLGLGQARSMLNHVDSGFRGFVRISGTRRLR